MADVPLPVYTVIEKTASGRWCIETICGDGNAVEFQLQQCLKWHSLPKDTPLTRTPDKFEPLNVVVVRPVEPRPDDLRWIIRRHNHIFTLEERGKPVLDPMRVDPIVPEPA